MAKRKPLWLTILLCLALIIPLSLVYTQRADPTQPSTTKGTASDEAYVIQNLGTANGGHWEFQPDFDIVPYHYSNEVCERTALHLWDCNDDRCSPNLMKWVYMNDKNQTYPKFDVEEFRRKMHGKKILFVGTSLVRQQVEALLWTLGHEKVNWKINRRPYLKKCFTERYCFEDTPSQATICFQFMGSIATQRYTDGNYSLGPGAADSSCLLKGSMLTRMTKYDVVILQTTAYHAGLPTGLGSPTSPQSWIESIIPTVYYDAWKPLLSKLSKSPARTVFVLGHVGSDCKNKTSPEPFVPENIPIDYGWFLAPKLWDSALQLIEDEQFDVQVVDVREPTMQSVHAHPEGDCLHFCQNSAALTLYLDIFWNEVFSQF